MKIAKMTMVVVVLPQNTNVSSFFQAFFVKPFVAETHFFFCSSAVYFEQFLEKFDFLFSLIFSYKV